MQTLNFNSSCVNTEVGTILQNFFLYTFIFKNSDCSVLKHTGHVFIYMYILTNTRVHAHVCVCLNTNIASLNKVKINN